MSRGEGRGGPGPGRGDGRALSRDGETRGRLGETRGRRSVEGPFCTGSGSTPLLPPPASWEKEPRVRELRASSLALTASRWSRLAISRSTESSRPRFSSFSWWREDRREAMSKWLACSIRNLLPCSQCLSSSSSSVCGCLAGSNMPATVWGAARPLS